MKKPEAKDIFFESMFFQENVSTLVLIVSIALVVITTLILLTIIKQKNVAKEEETLKEIKMYLLVIIAFFSLTTLGSLYTTWQNAKELTQEEDVYFLSIESNNRWFSDQIEDIYTDLEPKEYNIYKITSIERAKIPKDEIFEKVTPSYGKEKIVINYIESLERGMLFKIKALIIDEKKEIEEITFLANFKVEEKDQVEKAFLYNTNDSERDIGPNIMFGEVKINKNE